MCGINGMYGLENLDDPRGIIVKMNQAIQHRGPDAEGVFQSKNVALGHRRLKIIDLSDVANQPFHSKDGRYTLVFNGEIYNYQSLQAELSDEFGFITNSDTEVVLYALIKWGKEAFSRFNGMFAIAFWDDHTSQLDRLEFSIKNKIKFNLFDDDLSFLNLKLQQLVMYLLVK